MRKVLISTVALSVLAACGGTSRLDDARAQRLVQMPGPQHYAERRVARELASRCARYAYDETLAKAMSEARAKSGAATALQQRGAVDLEADIKRRSLAARYGTDYSALDACATLDGEIAQQTALSVMVLKKG
ncbi:hypothetical protein ACXYMO_12405 [Arenibacterium sp. CAU 1754]